MRARTVSTIAAALLTITLIGRAPASHAAPPAVEQESLVVFLVRHGEKVDAGQDPELSAAGHERAAALAGALRDAKIEHVHSSDYNRTRSTAAPTAAVHGLEVELYDPRDLPALAKELRIAGGRHLVVGHSNTTPSMAGLLGGDPGPAIDEAGEYDRLYVVTIGRGGTASSVMLRYGKPYDPRPEKKGTDPSDRSKQR